MSRWELKLIFLKFSSDASEDVYTIKMNALNEDKLMPLGYDFVPAANKFIKVVNYPTTADATNAGAKVL